MVELVDPAQIKYHNNQLLLKNMLCSVRLGFIVSTRTKLKM